MKIYTDKQKKPGFGTLIGREVAICAVERLEAAILELLTAGGALFVVPPGNAAGNSLK